jgi:hypothetical protein
MEGFNGFECAGPVSHRGVNIMPPPLPEGRLRHKYGNGPFAKLVMPSLPSEAEVYLWELNKEVVYVGQTSTPLSQRLGSQGYSTISNYNTFARLPSRSNGGQQTNCRINTLANDVLSTDGQLRIWIRATAPADAAQFESQWMRDHGMPPWNRRDES